MVTKKVLEKMLARRKKYLNKYKPMFVNIGTFKKIKVLPPFEITMGFDRARLETKLLKKLIRMYS